MFHYFKASIKLLNSVSFPKFQYIIGLLLGGLMFPVLQISIGLMQKYLINAVEYNNIHYMNYVYAMAVVVLVIVLLLNPIGKFLKERSIATFEKNLKEKMMENVLSYRYSVYETYQTGDLITRIRDDLEALPNIYLSSYVNLLLGIFYGGGSVIVLMILNWPLAIVVFLLGVVETFTMAKISQKLTKLNEALQAISSKQNQTFFDIIQSIGFIKLASIKGPMETRYGKVSEEFASNKIRINKVSVALNVVNNFFVAFNLLFILSMGIVLYLFHMTDLGTVMSFLFLQDGISYMIFNVREFLTGTKSQMVNYHRVMELMDQDKEDIEKQNPTVLRNEDITIRDLSFCYPNTEEMVLNRVNFIIPKGKVTVIYGESGVGKSTLIKMLLALYPIQSGSIRIGTTEYAQLHSVDIRHYYAYVDQTSYLFHETIEDNIRCGNESATFEEVVQAAKFAKAHAFIMNKPDGYQTMVQEQGSNFSGGERQRIVIARSILKNAPTVILDEATNAIDMESESYIYEYARNIARQGKTVLIIAHRDTIKGYADNTIRMGRRAIVDGKDDT